MKLRTPHRLILLALVAPTLAVVPSVGPAAATRPDAVSPAYVVDEWTDGDPAQLPDEPYSRVEVTYTATYGITLDGQVRTAIPSYWDQAVIAPQFDRPIVDITGVNNFAMAVDDLGHLHTWGAPPTISDDDRAETYRDISADGGAAIGVTTDGELRYWGNAASQYAFDPTEVDGADIVSIDVSSSAAVAVTSDGHVLSAGGAITGEWGVGTTFPSERADETFVAADAGLEFAVALTDDGDIVAWGVDHEGRGETTVPALPAGRHAVAVSAGMWMAAAVLDDGSILRWGQGERTVIPTQRPGLPVVDIDLDRYRSAVTYATLISTGAPTISGTPEFGTELTATSGTWSSEPDEVHYTWTSHSGGTDQVVGTDSPTYTPTAADALNWATLSVTVTSERDGFVGGTATSAETGHVAQLQFTTAPTLTLEGEARVGGSITAVATDAVPVPDSGDYAWFTVVRGDDPDGFDDELDQIEGADTATLELTPDLVGKTVFANLTVYKEGYEPGFDETTDVVVAPGTLSGPTVTVSGTPEVGRTITATASGIAPAADSVDYAWYVRTGPATDQVAPITGATAAALTLTADLAGKTVLARATATKTGYSAVTADSADLVVVPGSLTAPTVTLAGRPRVGQTLTATAAADPQATATRYQWLRGTTPIPGATAATYRVAAADLGLALRVQVTTGAAGRNDATATSAGTAPVTLGTATLAVTVPKKVTSGKKITVKVQRLAAGEKVVVTVGGTKVTGRANAAGVAKVKVKVTGKAGKRAVMAVGSLPDRSGRATVRVVPPRRR